MEINLTAEQLAVMTAVITGILQSIKQLPFIKSNLDKIKPFFVYVAMVLAFGYLYLTNGDDLTLYIVPSILIGLSSAGLYSGVKAISTTATTKESNKK